MSQRIFLFSSTDETGGTNEAGREAEKVLKQLPNVDLKQVREAKVLEGRVLLPFIETAAGDRYYGLDSIKKFVEQHNGAA